MTSKEYQQPCNTVQEVTMNVIKMQKDIEYIKQDTNDMKKDIKEILNKFDSADKIYAKKSEVNEMKREFNWIKSIIISTMVAIIGYLIHYIFFRI